MEEYVRARDEFLALPLDKVCGHVEALRAAHPDNLALRFFNHNNYFAGLDDAHKRGLMEIVQSGVAIPGSSVGCYARRSDDYAAYAPFFDRILAAFHKVDAAQLRHSHSFSLPSGAAANLAGINVGPLSMRIRLARNIRGFPFATALDAAGRRSLEAHFVAAAVAPLTAAFGGSYRSMSTGAAHPLTEEDRAAGFARHVCFGDMRTDKYLHVAGVAGDWPEGRGIYTSADEDVIVWVGEEDHLRIIVLRRSSDMVELLGHMRRVLACLDGLSFQEVHGGAATTCPSNCGSGMRASVHLALPALTDNGANLAAAKAIAKENTCQIRGESGEGTAAGSGGIVDVSASVRFGIKESDIILVLFKGIRALVERESAAAHTTPLE